MTMNESAQRTRMEVQVAPSHLRVRRIARACALTAAAFAGSLLASGCVSDNMSPDPPADAGGAFWSLSVAPGATTVAVGGTQQLTPRPLTGAGQSATVSNATVTYSSSDPTAVTVDANGVVKGIAPTTTSKTITIRMTANGVTKTASAFVTVTAAPSVMATVVGNVLPAGDSAILGAQGTGASQTKTLRPQARTAAGTTIPNVTFLFEALTPTIATVGANTGVVTGVAPGTAKFAVSTTAFGVTKADTVSLTITRPIAATITYPVTKVLDIPSVTVQRNATVTWTNSSGTNFDVTFTSVPTGAVVADIPTFASGSQSRKLTVPGTYAWKSTNANVSGTVIVE